MVRTCAQRWAESLPAGQSVRWNELDLEAVRGYPGLERLIDPNRKFGRSREGVFPVLEVIWRILTLFLISVLWIFPSAVAVVFVLGAAKNAEHAGAAEEFHIALPASGIAFSLSGVSMVVMMVSWLRTGRLKDAFFMKRAMFGSVFGVACLLAFANINGIGEVAFGSPSVVIAAAATLLSVLTAVAMAVWSKPGSSEPKEPFRPVRIAIERVPTGEQAAMRADVATAIDILEQRALIDEEEASLARTVPLGKLTWYMNEEHTEG